MKSKIRDLLKDMTDADQITVAIGLASAIAACRTKGQAEACLAEAEALTPDDLPQDVIDELRKFARETVADFGYMGRQD